jgi:hypothetical protein
MKTTMMITAAAAALTLSAGAASAQAWMPMIERQAVLDDRISAAVATGDMSQGEASSLRRGMSSLIALEGRYRYGGLSEREKVDLDRRYALLDDRVRLIPAAAPMDEGWTPLDDRKIAIDARIDQGIRSGQLTATEAEDLRDDFNAIARQEAAYRVDGLSPAERADLNDRFDELSARIRVARVDGDRTYGWNRY